MGFDGLPPGELADYKIPKKNNKARNLQHCCLTLVSDEKPLTTYTLSIYFSVKNK